MKRKNLDPLPKSVPSQSSKDTSKYAIRDDPWFSSVQSGSSSKFETSQSKTQLATVRCPIESPLAKELKRSLLRRVLCDDSEIALQYHRQRLLTDISKYLKIKKVPNEWEEERDELLNVLLRSTGSVARFPSIESVPTKEWTKLLLKWAKNKKYADVQIYRLLAVDGFRGIGVPHLKEYLPNVIHFATLRHDNRNHVRATRCMYYRFDKLRMTSLTGMDVACIVFLALVKLFEKHLSDTLDDQVHVFVKKAKVESAYLIQCQNHSEEDLLSDKFLEDLAQVYDKSFPKWKQYGIELMNSLAKWKQSKITEMEIESGNDEDSE